VLVEGSQAVGAAVDVLAARGLAGIAVRFECRHDRVDVARGERALVLGHDVWLAQLRVALQHGRTVRVAAGQRPAARVDPELVEPTVELAVGDDRDRKIDSPVLAVEVQKHLPKAVPPGDDALDVVYRNVALLQPRALFSDEGLEGARALDPPAHGVVQLGLAGERVGQGTELPGPQAVVVGHGFKLVPLLLIQHSRQRRRREQLGDPRHPVSVPHPTACPRARARALGHPEDASRLAANSSS
jgi:hypothetical protein